MSTLTMEAPETTFEGYSYRTSSRFGGRVTVSVKGDRVSVTGPRLAPALYRLWIAAQALLLALVPLALGAAVLRLDWRWGLATLVLLGVHCAAGGIGAGCLWELQNVTDFVNATEGDTASFSTADVEQIKIGQGWARRGMWLLLLPYFKGIDMMAQGVTVSFVAPDGTTNGGVYAIQLCTPEKAQALAEILQGRQPPEPAHLPTTASTQ